STPLGPDPRAPLRTCAPGHAHEAGSTCPTAHMRASARPWGRIRVSDRAPARLRRWSGGELAENELARPGGVRLTPHLLHHLADERAGGLDLAAAHLLGDVGVGGDRLVHRGL